MPQESTVAKVCVALARARSDAGLLTGAGGVMTGIVTAIDLTRSGPMSRLVNTAVVVRVLGLCPLLRHP